MPKTKTVTKTRQKKVTKVNPANGHTYVVFETESYTEQVPDTSSSSYSYGDFGGSSGSYE